MCRCDERPVVVRVSELMYHALMHNYKALKAAVGVAKQTLHGEVYLLIGYSSPLSISLLRSTVFGINHMAGT